MTKPELETANHLFWLMEDNTTFFGYRVLSRQATKDELQQARTKAKELSVDRYNIQTRTCWQCNGAHYHFLQGDWGTKILGCYACGKFYFNKIDITAYDN